MGQKWWWVSLAKAGFSQDRGLEETVAVDPGNPGPGGQQS